MKKSFVLIVVAFLTIFPVSASGPLAPEKALELASTTGVLIDVRTPAEFASGALGDAVNIPYAQILAGVASENIEKSRPIVLYCRSGRRSGIAKETLEAAGFTNVINAGGYESLKALQSTDAIAD